MTPQKDNPENEESYRFIASCHKAEECALRLIARAEQNTPGLTIKLERKHFEPAVIKEVISGLLERGLLNDERYAVLWLRSSLAKQVQSPKWLLLSLRKRGIDRKSSKKALEEVLDPETEYTLLLKYAEKPKKTPKNREKPPLRTVLKYEGFSVESIDRYFDLF